MDADGTFDYEEGKAKKYSKEDCLNVLLKETDEINALRLKNLSRKLKNKWIRKPLHYSTSYMIEND